MHRSFLSMPMQRRMRMIAGAATALCMLATNVEAATYYWVGVPSGSPNWEVADNWSTVSKGGAGGSHAVPTVLDNVVLSSSGTTVRLRSNAKVRSLVLTNTWTGSLIFGTGSLVVGSGSSVTGVQVRVGGGTVNTGTGLLAVAGSLTQTGGSITNIQRTVSLSGSLAISGASSVFQSTGSLILSGSGTQTLTLTSASTIALRNMIVRNTGESTTNSVVIAGGNLNLSGALTITQGKLDLATNSKALTVRNGITVGSNALASLATNSNVNLSGSLTVNSAGGGLAVTAGTVTLNGSGAQTISLGGNRLFNLTINNSANSSTQNMVRVASNPLFLSGALTITRGILNMQNQALNVDGSVTVANSALAALSGTTMNVGGDLTVNTAGTFSQPSGTMTLDGTTQTLSGAITFTSLTKTTSASYTLSFSAGKTITVLDTITLHGASCSAKLLLRSTDSGVQWKIDPQGNQSLLYLDVKDMRDINITTFTPLQSTDSGNNTNFAYSTCTTVATPAEVAAAASGGGGGGGGGVRRASVSSSKTVTTKVAVPAKPSAKVVAPTRASRVVVRKQATTLKKQSASVAARKAARMSKRK